MNAIDKKGRAECRPKPARHALDPVDRQSATATLGDPGRPCLAERGFVRHLDMGAVPVYRWPWRVGRYEEGT